MLTLVCLAVHANLPKNNSRRNSVMVYICFYTLYIVRRIHTAFLSIGE